jgi:transcriptional regulator with XRE-family HTH domain
MPTLGRYLRAAREAKGLTLRDVAKKAGVSPTFLSFLETDQAASKKGIMVKEETVNALAEVLGEKPIVLMAMAGKMPRRLQDIVLKHPQEFALLLERLEGVSEAGVLKVAATAKKVRDGKW